LFSLGNNELPAWSSIVRVRRKIQEMNPELRGNKYEKRQQSRKRYIKEIREFEVEQIRRQINNGL
jgi:deoxyribodipyrimidine photolyase